METSFRWNDWNLNHIAEHGVTAEEAEAIVRHARRNDVRHAGDDKFVVRGRGRGGRLLQVIFVSDDAATIYVIHARPLTPKEKRRFRR